MAWRDWIQPPEVSQLSQLSASQNDKKGEKQPKKAAFSDSATVTLATPATDPVIALVACRDCRHYQPDPVNPPAGLGQCKIDAQGDRLPWPALPRRCGKFEIHRAALFRLAKAACKGTALDPSELTDWLINQGDPGWLNPPAVQRWARLICEQGWP